VSTADLYNKGLGRYAELHRIPFVIAITDISVFLDLVHPHATHLVITDETARAVRSFPSDSAYFAERLDSRTSTWKRISYILRMYREFVLGMRHHSIFRNVSGVHAELNRVRCVNVGPMVRKEHFAKRDRAEMRRRHGIHVGETCVLVLSGSIGGRFVEQVTRALQRSWTGDLTVLAVCGRAETTLAKVRRLAAASNRLRVLPLGFVDDLDELYAASDAVIARPSAGVFSEALLARCPPVLPRRALSNDVGCLELVRMHGLGEIFRGYADLPRALSSVLSARASHVEAMDRFLEGSPSSFEELEDLLCQEVLGDKPAARNADQNEHREDRETCRARTVHSASVTS